MYHGTSTTSLTIDSSDSFSITTQSGLEWIAGDPISIWSDADTSNYMTGVVTSYSGTTLAFDSTVAGGSGTFTDWSFNLAGSVAQIQMRRGLDTDWASANPILARAEFGVEKSSTGDTVRFKIGDGATHWNDLPYQSGEPTIEVVAAEDIPAFSVVTAQGNIADSSNTAHNGKVVGITEADVSSGLIATLAVDTEVINVLWGWSPGTQLFLNGTTISATPPSSGFSQLVAVARNATTIIVRLEPPILL